MYFREENIEFFSSGCILLDCVLGGGYPLGRMVNIVGDKSSGKTLLAIEACVNFNLIFKEAAQIYYIESEAAFDFPYASLIGLNIESDNFHFIEDVYTVEDFHNKLIEIIDKSDKESKNLIIVDSLDGLSDKAEMERGLDKGTYGTSKARMLSEIFRRDIKRVNKSGSTLLIVSQVRDNIGVMFGEKKTRSGGKALDHYASQILWLAEIRKIKRTMRGIEKVTGIEVKAQCKKNKVGPGFRQCTFPIFFGFGVDDVLASIEWLIKVDELKDFFSLNKTNYKRILSKMDNREYNNLRNNLFELVPDIWDEIEEDFKPNRSKYSE